MGKITILFIIISLYAIIIHSNIFDGFCDAIVNEDECADKIFSKKLTQPKSYQVIAHMKFEKNHGVTMFYSYLASNLIATISNDKEILFTINCFKIPFEIKHQKFMDFKLKIMNCNDVHALFKQVRSQNYHFFSHSHKAPFFTTILKIDNYLSIWGCIPNANSSSDRAAWILMDNENKIEFDSEKLRNYLEDFLEKIRPKINKTGLKLTSKAFKIYGITDEYYGCYNSLDEKAVYSEIRREFPVKNKTKSSNIDIKESTKMKFTFAILMFFGHIIFMVGFFSVGYLIVVWYYKE